MVLVSVVTPGVFLIEVGEQLTDADVITYIQAFDQTIKAKTKFGCIIRYQGGRPKKSKEGHRLENDWLKANKVQMKNYCFGIALLSNPGVLALLQKIIMKGFGKNFFGCECNLFFDQETAQTWLLAQQANT